jgi:hypothetical protein
LSKQQQQPIDAEEMKILVLIKYLYGLGVLQQQSKQQ